MTIKSSTNPNAILWRVTIVDDDGDRIRDHIIAAADEHGAAEQSVDLIGDYIRADITTL